MSSRKRITALALLAVVLGSGYALAEIDQTTRLMAEEYPYTPIPEGDREYNILWDLTHGVYLYYEPSGAYSSMVAELAANDFTMHTTDQGIHNINLDEYDVLVINVASSYDYAYTQEEVDAAVDFVMGGGGLVVMGDNPGVWNGNTNPISEAFGTTCGIDDCGDATSFIAHEIFGGVDYITFAAGGSIHAADPSQDAAWDAGGRLVMSISEVCGYVLVTGDVNWCDNDRLYFTDNLTFTLNAFEWLATSDPSPAEDGSWGEIKALFK